MCRSAQRLKRPVATVIRMFKLIATMRRGSSCGMPPAWAHYEVVDAARTGAAELLRDDRVLRVMVVRNEVPPTFVEWVER